MNHEQKLKQALQELDALKGKIEGLMRPELVVGKWYKDPNSKYLVCVKQVIKAELNYAYCYGFDKNGTWVNNWDTNIDKSCREATIMEIESALIKEAKSRGYKLGDILLPNNTLGNSHQEDKLTNGMDMAKYLPNKNSLRIQFGIYNKIAAEIFRDGVWAEVVDNSRTRIDQDIQKLRSKYPQYRFTIHVEDNV